MNSEYQRKLKAALDELSKAGIRKSNYDPPLHKLLRKIGVYLRLPYYNTFSGNALSQGISFVVFFGLLKFLIEWYRDRLESFSFLSVLFGGLIVGFSMAFYYASKKKKHNLSDWDDL